MVSVVNKLLTLILEEADTTLLSRDWNIEEFLLGQKMKQKHVHINTLKKKACCLITNNDIIWCLRISFAKLLKEQKKKEKNWFETVSN